MKTIIKLAGITPEITCSNKREVHLVYCLQGSIEGHAKDIRNKCGIYESLIHETFFSEFVQDIAGMFSAMYYLHMIPAPVTDQDVWNAIINQSESFTDRNAWQAMTIQSER